MVLNLIWISSIVLSGSSILALFFLIARRLVIQAAEIRLLKRRAEIGKAVQDFLTADEGAIWTLKLKSVADERIMLGIISNLLQSLSGDLRARILALVNATVDVGRMLQLLRRGNPADRAKVAARLYWSSDPHVIEGLKQALDDKHQDVVLAAANSLLAAGHHIDLGEFMLRVKARDMLDHRGARNIVRQLAKSNVAALAAMIDGPDAELAVLATESIGPVMDPALITAVKAVANVHLNIDVRAAAVRALGNGAVDSASDIIAQALHDVSWEVCVQAAIAAGRLKLTSLIPELTECLGSTHWWVRWRAAQALAKLGPAGAAVLRGFPFDSPVATIAEAALAEIHNA